VLNTAISAGYYLRVVRVMTLDDPVDPAPIHVPFGGRALVTLLAVLVVVAGVFWNPLNRAAERGARAFESSPTKVTGDRP